MSVPALCVIGVALAGCGQKGPLYLPTEPAAANRATLPTILKAPFSRADAPAAPPTPAASAPTAPNPLPYPESLTTPALPLSDYEMTR